MTPRPLISSSSRRPLSAIFLGSLPPKDPKEFNIPDLPEPPESPGAVSTASGLPSPPATNSTGSGSAGDNNSASSGSTRQRPVSYSSSSNLIMSTENNGRPTSLSKTSRPSSDEDDENDHANEEDNTARLDLRLAGQGPSENVAALQRVKSLAQRNRMALDKLSSRLNTPSPPSSSRASRSPLPPPSSSSSVASSSRLSSHSHSHSVPQPRHNDTLSGSETERESLRAPTPRSDSNSHSYRSSSPELSTTPPLALDSRQRHRRTSEPASPDKTRQASPGPSRTPRKRVSMASAMSAPGAESGRYSVNRQDVTEAALAAVASTRRSPTENRRSRQPLPREFRDRERRSLDGRNSIEPVTPHLTPHRDSGYDEDNSPRTAAHTAANAAINLQYSPRGGRSNRSSTVRDLTRRHQTRWLSDDLSNNAVDSGRRQAHRGGSAESGLNGSAGAGGRLAGEGLRAAGISMRGSARQAALLNADVFGDDRDAKVSVRRTRSTAASSSTGRTVEWEDEERLRHPDVDHRSRTNGSGAHVGEGVGPSTSRLHFNSDPPHAQTILVAERDARGGGRIVSSRPATSAEFYHDDGSRNGTYSVQSRRTTYDLSYRLERRDSPSTHPGLQQTPGEPGGSRMGTLTRRHTMTPLSNGSVTSLNNTQSAEHTRLMLESLSMFQSQLCRLPNQTQTVHDLSDQSGAILRSSERLNRILRAATTNAVQQQIAVEIDDEDDGPHGPNHPAQIWRDVGSDFRESLRESDDIVRSLTGFILSVGKLLKETAAGAAPDSGHLRTMSLDEEIVWRPPSDPGVERNSSRRSRDGRQSVESRLSWEQTTSTGGADVSRRLSSRADVSLARPPPLSRDRDGDQDRPTPSRVGFNPPPSATRRLFAPREQREQQMTLNASALNNTPSGVVDLSVEYEPSPTPASRYPLGERSRPPAYSTPPPLPSLPSESLLQKSTSLLDKGTRRKVSLASITTVRAPNAPFSLSTPNPTTAVTAHTVSTSPETSMLPLVRTDSGDSVRSSVTFSRPSGGSVFTLQQQRNRDEARRRVTSSTPEEGPSQMRSPLSGSETERDTRRRTLGVRAARMSLDSAVEEHEGEGGNPQPKTITLPSQGRARRRTVTEIFR
ncbi:hypothetical protein PAXINDRAFT_167568 [Paxillus involutus ATCC 200175]|nr:hypothetical protein PAXINDRAFT_167568 [Paxillus involutus ATCC 200175]